MAVTIDGSQGLDTDNTELTLEVGGSEKARIDSSGNLGIGTTSPQKPLHTKGSATAPCRFERLTDDGHIIQLYKDGAAVGNIGTASNDLYIGDDSVNLRFRGGSNNIIPASSGGGIRDNAIDLGQSTSRFKDLYLSGGVYVGGTGSANYLDDYEEGTWTPTSNGNFGTFTTAEGVYTKIGNVVYIKGYVEFSGASTTAVRSIGGIPFTAANDFSLTSVEGVCNYWGDLYGLGVINGSSISVQITTTSQMWNGSPSSNNSFRILGWYKTS